MMGRQIGDQASLFYEFRLDDLVPKSHLLRRINVFVTAVLADMHEQLKPYYSEIGRPSVDPELMMRMLIIGYCYGLRSERKLCEEVTLHLAYRWFCRLDQPFPRERHSAPYLRARCHAGDGDGARQRRRVCRGRERHRGKREPLSRQGARRTRLDREAAPEAIRG